MSKFPLFIISTSTPDYTHFEFLDVEDEAEAREEYQGERDDADSDTYNALFKVNGPGHIELGAEATAGGEIECLEDSVYED
jgi:hypothetical protein